MSISPSEEDLTQALVDLKSREPQLGISKIHALLLKEYPDWLVSEKRTRKVLQLQGLIVTSSPTSGANEPPVFPTSRLIQTLDLSQWTSKIEVKYYNKKKGKGLVAIADIEEGEAIWREDPFIISPEWYVLYQHTRTGCPMNFLLS